MLREFVSWTGGRTVTSIGTNAGAKPLPFQNWRHFKEAFAPELIKLAVDRSSIPIERCLDPFGGSGTTGLACQFLGIHPILVEVNPFLADLIQAKLSDYNPDELALDIAKIFRRARSIKVDYETWLAGAPATFIEPGQNNRWIFDKEVAERIG